MTDYFVYLLKRVAGKCRNSSYVGYTSNLKRRLRQHNAEIKGGAKATRGGKWTIQI
jgi:predicted GIY-YIG superfamily endonuclease